MRYSLSKIAYVTDLHLGSAATARARTASFNSKLSLLRKSGVKWIINGGDMFDLRDDMKRPNGLADSKVSFKLRQEMLDHSQRLTSKLMELIALNMGGSGLYFSILGNSDQLSVFELNRFTASRSKAFYDFRFPSHRPYNGRVSAEITGANALTIAVSGLSGIPALPFDTGAAGAFANNPWYKGILDPEKYNGFVMGLGMPGRENVVVTHMPALGAMDTHRQTAAYSASDFQGSPELKVRIEGLSPILHLTGHVHSAPMVSGHYTPFVVSPNGRTVTVNPGGDDLHDETLDGIEGVKIAVIDPYTLIDLRDSSALTKDAIISEKAIEIL